VEMFGQADYLVIFVEGKLPQKKTKSTNRLTLC